MAWYAAVGVTALEEGRGIEGVRAYPGPHERVKYQVVSTRIIWSPELMPSK